MKTLIAVLALCCAALAQGTPVVPLSPQDVARVKTVHQAMLDAEKKWKDLQGEIGKKYLTVPKGDPNASPTRFEDPPVGVNTFTVSGYSVTLGGDVTDDQCNSQARAKRKAEEERERKAEAARDAMLPRVRKGFADSYGSLSDVSDLFIYSADWKYLLPKPKPMAGSTQTSCPIHDWQGNCLRVSW